MKCSGCPVLVFFIGLASYSPYSFPLLYLGMTFVLDLISCTFMFLLLRFFNCTKIFST